MEGKKLEILVVEDKEENIQAAKKYFTEIEAKADFAKSYDKAVEKLGSKVYACVVTDLYFPKSGDSEPEKLGFELIKEIEKQMVPYVLITGGVDHHEHSASYVLYPWSDKSKLGVKDSSGSIEGEQCQLTKDMPEAWKKAFEGLIAACDLETLFETHKRRIKHCKKSEGVA